MSITKKLRHLFSARRTVTKRATRSARLFAGLEGLEQRTLLSIGLTNSPAQVSQLQTSVTTHPGTVSKTTTTTDSQTQTKTLNDLPSLEKYAISSSIGADQPQYLATATAGGYTLANSPNSYTTSLSTTGIVVSTGSDTWSLDLESFGRGTTQTMVSQRSDYHSGSAYSLPSVMPSR